MQKLQEELKKPIKQEFKCLASEEEQKKGVILKDGINQDAVEYDLIDDWNADFKAKVTDHQN